MRTFATLALVLSCAPAFAQSTPDSHFAPARAGYHLGVEAITDFPMQVGGRVWAELPHRLRLSTTFGYLPGGYVDVINDILVAANAYTQSEADLIKAALTSSFLWRLHLGWRPLKKRGFYFEVGYGLVTLGGSATTAELIGGVTGKSIPPEAASMSKGYNVRSTLHMIDVDIGYQWFVWRGISVRLSIGLAATVAAETKVSPGYTPRAQTQTAVKAFTSYAASYLDDLYTSYVFVPTVGLGVGYRLF